MKNCILFVILILVFSCRKTDKNTENKPPKPSNLTSKQLAQTYCASCHQFPEPQLLDKATWEKGVLPKMYGRLGLEPDGFNLFSELSHEDMMVIIRAGIYPEKPAIAKEDWDKIVKFYLDNSPEKTLPQDKKVNPQIGLKSFQIKTLFGKNDELPAITLVKGVTNEKSIYIGFRGTQNFIKKYDLDFTLLDSIALSSPISDITIGNGALKYVSMGIMDPNDQKKGKYYNYNLKNKSNIQILDSLQRPVQLSFGDLNQDKIEDFVICNFGNELGNLAWYDGRTNKENILSMLPGARNSVITDLNHDNLPDIIVLMTQAREQIMFYINKGGGVFVEKTLIVFPPVYGSSYFQMVDFNKDGHLDILYTNGDNADLSISLKKYHGVRIFMNDGRNNFKQSYFYPMYGASKAMVADFDLDGDLDFAAISFFTDPKQKPNEGFLLFNNKGDNQNFEINTFKNAQNGKWMVMDVTDLDADGDKDIVLGSFIKSGMQKFDELINEKVINAIILKNITSSKQNNNFKR